LTANKIKIESSGSENDAGEYKPMFYYVSQNGLQHGFFKVNDYPTPDEALAAARALVAELKATAWVSPFVKHEEVILACYGTASKLRRFVLSLYNGHAYPVDLSDISGMDKKHFGIVQDLMSSYHNLGESDHALIALAERIKKEFNPQMGASK